MNANDCGVLVDANRGGCISLFFVMNHKFKVTFSSSKQLPSSQKHPVQIELMTILA